MFNGVYVLMVVASLCVPMAYGASNAVLESPIESISPKHIRLFVDDGVHYISYFDTGTEKMVAYR